MKLFKTIAVIGKGAYAKVVLARHLGDNKLYAIKMLKKIYIVEKNQQRQIMMEKQILAKIDHPFLVKLKMSFQDEKKLYFVLEYCPGGQLFSILADQQKLAEDQAKFYAGQIVLALDALHQHQIVYRDLKAQNIIVDAQGFIKLTDFGLSKVLNKDQTTMSICGTSQYLAPEMIKKIGYGPDVDWWCLGCLIYQMVTGFPPFQGNNRMQLFQNIVFKKPTFTGMSENLADLLQKLLAKDPTKRLGHGNVETIKNHPWFQKLKWQALLQKKYKAPFIPNLSSDIDTGNFDVEFTRTAIESQEEMEQQSNGNNFKDFSFGD